MAIQKATDLNTVLTMPKRKEITWKIGFNYNNRTIKDPSIVDVLRDNQK